MFVVRNTILPQWPKYNNALCISLRNTQQDAVQSVYWVACVPDFDTTEKCLQFPGCKAQNLPSEFYFIRYYKCPKLQNSTGIQVKQVPYLLLPQRASQKRASQGASYLVHGVQKFKMQSIMVGNICNQHSLRAQWYIFDVQPLLRPCVRNLPREQGVQCFVQCPIEQSHWEGKQFASNK